MQGLWRGWEDEDEQQVRMGRLDEAEGDPFARLLFGVKGRRGGGSRRWVRWPGYSSSRPQAADGRQTCHFRLEYTRASASMGGRCRAAEHQLYVQRYSLSEDERVEAVVYDADGPVDFGTLGDRPEEAVAFWRAAEREERPGGRVQCRIIAELPWELLEEPGEIRVVLREMLQVWVERRVPVHAVAHMPDISGGGDRRNVHVHILAADRPAELDGGEWRFARRKDRSMQGRAWVAMLRDRWCDHVNGVLERLRGAAVRRFSPAGYTELGIPKVPGVHLGPRRMALERAGVATAAGVRNAVIELGWRHVEAPALAAAREAARVENMVARVARAVDHLAPAVLKVPTLAAAREEAGRTLEALVEAVERQARLRAERGALVAERDGLSARADQRLTWVLRTMAVVERRLGAGPVRPPRWSRPEKPRRARRGLRGPAHLVRLAELAATARSDRDHLARALGEGGGLEQVGQLIERADADARRAWAGAERAAERIEAVALAESYLAAAVVHERVSRRLEAGLGTLSEQEVAVQAVGAEQAVGELGREVGRRERELRAVLGGGVGLTAAEADRVVRGEVPPPVAAAGALAELEAARGWLAAAARRRDEAWELQREVGTWRRAWREGEQERARLARIEADLVRAVLAQAKQLGGGADIGRSVAGPLLEGARADSSVLPAAGETAQRVRAALLAVGRPDTPELVQGSRLLAATVDRLARTVADGRRAGAASEALLAAPVVARVRLPEVLAMRAEREEWPDVCARLAAAAGAAWRHAGARSELEQRGLAEELRRWAGKTPGRGPARPHGRDRAG